MYQNNRKIKKDLISGFTLIDALIGVVLSGILLLSIFECFKTIAYSTRHLESIESFKNSIDQLHEIFENEMRLAWKVGCAVLYPDFPIMTHGLDGFGYETAIQIPNKDTLITKRIDPPYFKMIKAQSDQIQILGQAKLKKNDKIVISNCRYVELNQVMNVSYHQNMTNITLKYPLFYPFNAGDFLSRYISTQYLWGHKNNNGDTSELMYSDSDGNSGEIIKMNGTMNFYKLQHDHGCFSYDGISISGYIKIQSRQFPINLVFNR